MVIPMQDVVQIFHPVHSLTRSLLKRLAVVDKITYEHSFHVAGVASFLAEEMGLWKEKSVLYEAGLLHDVGKLHVPQELLSTRRTFNSLDRLVMQKHVQYTREMLLYYHYPRFLVEICCQHHERLDGSGYPRGLRGEAIFLEGRILAVADVFAALVVSRPYREAVPLQKAVEILRKEALNGRLSAEVVEVLAKKVDECYSFCIEGGFREER